MIAECNHCIVMSCRCVGERRDGGGGFSRDTRGRSLVEQQQEEGRVHPMARSMGPKP